MKKTHLRPNRRILILAVACAAIAWGAIIPRGAAAAGKPSPTVAPKTQAAGRLIIVRSATLGAYAVGLSIDGKQAAMINFNGRYDAPLAAGRHVLTVIPVPNRQAGKTTQTSVTVEAGKTYRFTATWANDDYILK
jgi:hypothetical protein